MDELPPNARAFLDAAASSDGPSPAERARADAGLRAALRERGVYGLPPLPAAAPSPAARVASSSALKLAAIGLSLLGAAAIAVIAPRPEPRASQPPAPVQPSQPPPPVAPAPEPAPNHEPDVDPPTAREPRARSTPRARTQRAALDDGPLQRELRLVAATNELLRQQRFTDALQLLDAGERDMHTFVLREERSALRILALCGRARDERALRESERFLRTSPQAVLAARVRAACQTNPGEAP